MNQFSTEINQFSFFYVSILCILQYCLQVFSSPHIKREDDPGIEVDTYIFFTLLLRLIISDLGKAKGNGN